MNKDCPLCGSTSIRSEERIEAANINYLYQRSLGVVNPLGVSMLEYEICGDCGLGFFDPMATGSENFYEDLQKFDWYYMTKKPEYAMAARYLPTNGNLLEVGAGRAAFASLVGRARYTGLEFNDKAIERARSTGISLLKETVEAHALTHAARYDAVVTFQVLEHVADPKSFLQACVDCLIPGGRLMIAVPSADGFLGRAVNSVLDLPPHHVSRWSDSTLHKIAQIFSLRCLSVEHEPVADYHLSWARQVQIETLLRRMFRLGQPLVDVSIGGRAVSLTSAMLARLLPIPVSHIQGHTVFACYEK